MKDNFDWVSGFEFRDVYDIVMVEKEAGSERKIHGLSELMCSWVGGHSAIYDILDS